MPSSQRNQLGGVTDEGLADVALMLLEKGADIYAENEMGLTPIFMAALNVKMRITEAMIDRWGADFDPPSSASSIRDGVRHGTATQVCPAGLVLAPLPAHTALPGDAGWEAPDPSVRAEVARP